MTIPVLYEDRSILICVKPRGVLSEEHPTQPCLPALLREQTGRKQFFCVHRLDRDTGGVTVLAKDGKAAARLSELMAAGAAEVPACEASQPAAFKEYLAVVHGAPDPAAGEMRDLLFHDKQKNKTFVVQRMRGGVKEARLNYETLAAADGLSLVRIRLRTGRSHQIRVQFASRKMPLAGDAKYGSPLRGQTPALWAYRLAFPWPAAPGGKIDCTAPPEEERFLRFGAKP